jgi:hypothetical protein
MVELVILKLRKKTKKSTEPSKEVRDKSSSNGKSEREGEPKNGGIKPSQKQKAVRRTN